MEFQTLQAFFQNGAKLCKKGPIALLLFEDPIEVESTIYHHLELGFKAVIGFGASDIETNRIKDKRFHRVIHDVATDEATCEIVNGVNDMALGRMGLGPWIYYGYNAEYLFYPFCESRTIGDMTIFSLEERRPSILTYVVDLYAEDLAVTPSGVSLEAANFDRGGYYALNRHDKERGCLDQQIDVFGGLRWRFEEHIRFERRKIDRVGLFRAAKDLELRRDFTFNIDEYNTYSCPWHHNLTAAICSFRTAKALRHNPGSSKEVQDFRCMHSTPFEWSSRQLMDCGFMETGQWF